ncbi:hypothetical protein [Chitinophaga sp. RAB17]|uniref:hypothetical protein n=1 Tax=Chitinophaga sp. RAB17 TaxID=3233049 RepID=UPI003F8E42C0
MSNAQNVLLNLHTLLSRLPVSFREKVCEECNWSVPTFYRKVRLKDIKEKDGKVIYALSSAERAMILKVLQEVVVAMEKDLQSYK